MSTENYRRLKVNMLKKYHPIWLNTHFNHPKEITPESIKACEMLADAGIPLGNQSVLLRGVNDCPHIMKDLVHGLVKMRVRPYYIYQCDLSMGIEHFRTKVSKGIEIIEALRGHTSGYAVPTFVVDALVEEENSSNASICNLTITYKSCTLNYEGIITTYTEPQYVEEECTAQPAEKKKQEQELQNYFKAQKLKPRTKPLGKKTKKVQIIVKSEVNSE